MKHIYYYVEPCPRCGSRKTGRYIKTPMRGSGYTKKESLKAGELIRFASPVPDNNGFCASCGYEWHTNVETKWWPSDRIEEEKAVRGTQALYERELKTPAPARNALFGRRQEEPEEPEEEEEYIPDTQEDDDYEFIDSRQKDVIELLYADERLIKKIMEKSV